MKRIFFFTTLIVAAMTTFLSSVLAEDDVSHLTIAEIVIETSGGTDAMDHNRRDYDILLQAILTAELDGALSDESAHLTVFAPNDGAFFALAKDLGYEKGYDEMKIFDFLVEALGTLGDAVEVLTDVLLYHVSSSVLTTRTIRHRATSKRSITTLQGETIVPKKSGHNNIILHDKDPDLVNPRVISPNNLEAKNGIIHTINRVLIPLNI